MLIIFEEKEKVINLDLNKRFDISILKSDLLDTEEIYLHYENECLGLPIYSDTNGKYIRKVFTKIYSAIANEEKYVII